VGKGGIVGNAATAAGGVIGRLGATGALGATGSVTMGFSFICAPSPTR